MGKKCVIRLKKKHNIAKNGASFYKILFETALQNN